MNARPVNPNGYRFCGIEQRPHGIQYGPHGRHTWAQPTQQQIKDRMSARRQEREANLQPPDLA